MSTYYSPGCNDDKAHICNNCEIDDGRPTLYWKNSDFDLCHNCLNTLFIQHIDPTLKLNETIKTTRKVISEDLRAEILKRDNYQCQSCGSSSKLEIDHIIPFSRGGQTDKPNLQVLCKTCNLSKRAM